MKIPAERLMDRVQPGDYVLLRGIGGKPRGEISSRELAEYVAIGAVEGVGSRSRLKYVQLIIEDGDVVVRKAEMSRLVRRQRSHSALENLMRMVSDRKTTFRERFAKRDEWGIPQSSGLWCWSHK